MPKKNKENVTFSHVFKIGLIIKLVKTLSQDSLVQRT